MNFVNKLTLSRAILGPIFLWSFLENKTNLAFICLCLNLIGDFFDGFLARKRKEVSKTGEVIDPAVDLLFFAFVGLSFSLKGINEINYFLIPILFISFSFLPNLKKGFFLFTDLNELTIFHTKTKYLHTPLIYLLCILMIFNLQNVEYTILFWLTFVLFTLTTLETFLRSLKFSININLTSKH
ncbi:MAG TPA: CDP-alcohol phosphatidyltransferase family protein [Candidatus Pacearchaeota archaeon]|nr:CDP-alcohol phosphatidyltransferase family protein [Candidatus Pacearchaeota archaeon]HOK93940.1 CDP-alcohol phosphatidyltransferase family protein [Candidatus Pacearchaeota archaeon]HPO75011.1 CDP-alcohol phosphatidyltransferase family protein [Candidatus Pacearchaeota archaeon]